MIKIQQPPWELDLLPKVYCGDRLRTATATGIAFINENLFVTASFLSKKLYLIELIDNKPITLEEVTLNHYPDLVDYKDGIIAISGYPHNDTAGWLMLYSLDNNKFIHTKDIRLENIKAHGVEIIDEYGVIITSNSDKSRGLLFINIDTEEIVKNFNNFSLYPKDCVIHGDNLLITCSESLPHGTKKVKIKESILYLFSLSSLEKQDEITFHGQTDSLTLLGENGFITIQGSDEILHFTLIDKKLSFIKRIPGFSFPHGVDSINDRIGVTNYGDNTIRIFESYELIK